MATVALRTFTTIKKNNNNNTNWRYMATIALRTFVAVDVVRRDDADAIAFEADARAADNAADSAAGVPIPTPTPLALELAVAMAVVLVLVAVHVVRRATRLPQRTSLATAA
jgi:hypothetical protein